MNGGDNMINYSLKALRVSRNIKQDEIASVLGIALPTYSRKECGISEFCASEIEKISLYFSLNTNQVNDIFFGGKLNANENSKSA